MSGSEDQVESAPQEAWEDDECLFCVPAHHENGEPYTVIGVLDHSQIPLGEDDTDHVVEVPMCAAHYEVFQRYQSANTVAEVRFP